RKRYGGLDELAELHKLRSRVAKIEQNQLQSDEKNNVNVLRNNDAPTSISDDNSTSLQQNEKFQHYSDASNSDLRSEDAMTPRVAPKGP
ncbi:640_t:CDS:2, partial [Acaulospora colombiana]